MATDVNADLYAEIESGIERIAALTAEGNQEGADELSTEISAMVDSIKGAGSVGKRKAYRDQLKAAAKPSAEVAVKAPATAPAEVTEAEGVDELVKLGAQRVHDVTVSKIKGGYEIAEILFDIRRRIILPDGTPDLNAKSQKAKDRSSEIYDLVIAGLPAEGQNEEADNVRAEISSIKRSAQDAMVDVKVKHALALDTSDPKELEPYAAVLAKAGNVKTSEALSAHYGFKLKTRRELEADRRAAKAIGGETDGLKALESGIKAMGATAKKTVEAIESIDPEAAKSLSDTKRARLIGEVKEQIAALNAILASLA